MISGAGRTKKLPEFADSLSLRGRYNQVGYMFLKRSVDILISATALLVLSPILLTISLLIAARDGFPVLFTQKRVGQNGRVIRVFKFRTMVKNAEEVLRNDPLLWAEYQQNFKLEHDPRITPIGKFLRSTSVDEFPQLWNVLKGEMSLVGPRPIPQSELETFPIEAQRVYLAMLPGCAGLWQCSGRSDTTYDERLALDRQYFDSASIRSDLKIILMTALSVLKREGAH